LGRARTGRLTNIRISDSPNGGELEIERSFENQPNGAALASGMQRGIAIGSLMCHCNMPALIAH
jgi:hypothetical protein